MTSRNSFFNLLKEDFRRRLWTFILASLVFFATFVVAFTMAIQNIVSRCSRASFGYTHAELVERVSDSLCKNFYGVSPWFILVAVVGAVICGMSGFAYLHSRKQMDFYHSLPIKRETIFAVHLVNGILIYAVPYLVGLLFTYLLCIVYGVMTWNILSCGLFYFVIHLMGYLLVYLVTIIAMMLTGKLMIAFFGNCVLNLYAPAVYALVITLKEVFFVTSYGTNGDMAKVFSVTRWISPISYYVSLIASVNKGENRFFLDFLTFLLLAAVFTVLALWLYKKRASEKADTAMSFKVTEPVIRVMLVLPVGVLTGLLFFAIQYDYGYSTAVFWLVFGGLLGGFLAHGFIEALYQGDIKKCLTHKVQMLASMILAAVIPLAFLFDIFGYDTYLPKKEDIANMAVVNRDLRFGGSFYGEDGWINPADYALENMEVTDIDAMYELATLCVKAVGENRTEQFMGYSPYYSRGNEEVFVTDFVIRYTMKDGSEVLRKYEYNFYAVLDILERIYNDEEYKRAVHPVFGLLETGYEFLYINCYAPATGVSVKVEKNCESILKTYAEEVLAMTFDELKNTAAIGELSVTFKLDMENQYQYTDSSTFLVYPSMTRTIALLKESGYNMQTIQNMTDTTIANITLYYSGDVLRDLGVAVDESEPYDTELYGEAAEYYEKYGIATSSYQELIMEITDPAEIEELKRSLVCSNYVSEFGPFPECEAYLSADVFLEASAGAAYTGGIVGWTEHYNFVEGSIPQFVIDRIFKELGVTAE